VHARSAWYAALSASHAATHFGGRLPGLPLELLALLLLVPPAGSLQTARYAEQSFWRQSRQPFVDTTHDTPWPLRNESPLHSPLDCVQKSAAQL
jgi:hypothetical protein